MRRILLDEPVTRFAIWSVRTGWMGIAVTGMTAFLIRAGRIEADAGMAALATGGAFAGVAATLALAAFARIWSDGRRGFGKAVGGMALALLVLGPPAILFASRQIAPQPVDVATDAERPPTFSLSPATLAARDGWAGPVGAPAEAGGSIAPLLLDLPFGDVVAIAERAAAARGLQVIERPQAGNSDPQEPTQLEARGRTLVLRLPVELAVRITPIGERARIDARAAAPRGNFDVGGNVAVLRAYLDEIEFLVALR